jgi:hypothetical protein
MKRNIDYNRIKKSHVIFNDIKGNEYEGEFTSERVERTTVPEGLYTYECRHNDDGYVDVPATIEDKVFVNFCGTFFTDKKVYFPDKMDHCIVIDKINYK